MIPATQVISFLQARASWSETSPTQVGLMTTFLRDLELNHLYVAGAETSVALEVLADNDRWCRALYLCAQEVETPWGIIDAWINLSSEPGGDLGDSLIRWVDAFHHASIGDERVDPEGVFMVTPARSAILLCHGEYPVEAIYFIHQDLRPVQAANLLLAAVNSHDGLHDFGHFPLPSAFH